MRSLASNVANFSSPSKLIGGGKDGGSPASVGHESQHDSMGEGHIIGHFEMLLFDMEKVVLATSIKTEERRKTRGEAVSDAVRVTLSLEASTVSNALISTTGNETTTTTAAGTETLTAANLAPVIAAGKPTDGKKDDKTVNKNDKTMTTAAAAGGAVPPVASVLLRSMMVVNCYVSPAGQETSSSTMTTNPVSGKGKVGEVAGSGSEMTKGKGTEANLPTSTTVTIYITPFHT